jgi:hypothetical protein
MAMTLSGDGSITGLVAGGLPDATITQPELATGVGGTGPAFSAIASAGTVTTTAANTKILFQTETFDTNNNFASSTFTPTVAGYYQINAMVAWGLSMAARNQILFYKNGILSANGIGMDQPSGNYTSVFSGLVYANGSTDYFDVYVYQQTGGNLTTLGNYSFFSGSLVRAA